MVAFPQLIAIPPSINTSPRLPLRQHLLTFLGQEASPASVAPLTFPGLKPWISGDSEAHPSPSAKLLGPGFSSRARTPCRSLGSCLSWLFHTQVQHPLPSDSVAVWGGQFDSCLPFSEMPNSLKLTNRQIDGLCLLAPLGQRARSPRDVSPEAAL